MWEHLEKFKCKQNCETGNRNYLLTSQFEICIIWSYISIIIQTLISILGVHTLQNMDLNIITFICFFFSHQIVNGITYKKFLYKAMYQSIYRIYHYWTNKLCLSWTIQHCSRMQWPGRWLIDNYFLVSQPQMLWK